MGRKDLSTCNVAVLNNSKRIPNARAFERFCLGTFRFSEYLADLRHQLFFGFSLACTFRTVIAVVQGLVSREP